MPRHSSSKLTFGKRIVEIDRYIGISRYLGFTDILVSAKMTDFIGLVGVEKMLLYSSRTQLAQESTTNQVNIFILQR